MDCIFIEHLEVETIIGVYDEERIKKQPIIVDLNLYYETAKAAKSDNLTYALDYHQICIDLHSFIGSSSYQLIEALGQAIVDRMLLNEIIEKVDCKLSKPMALNQAKNVGIKISRTRKSIR